METKPASERTVYINLPTAAVVSICFAAGLMVLGYFGSVAVKHWANSSQLEAASNLKIAELNLEASKHNCLQWPVGGQPSSIINQGSD
jgi:hypothetical protein